MNGVEEEVDPRIAMVQRAERALRENDPLTAASRALRAFPGMRAGSTTHPLWTRAARVLAVAIVRLDGELPPQRGMPATAAQRVANLTWAVNHLRGVAARRRDPTIDTELAEALAADPATRAEARTTLEELARRDVITSPYGWAALARLRAAAGDAAGQQAALGRCTAMASFPALCAAAEVVAAAR